MPWKQMGVHLPPASGMGGGVPATRTITAGAGLSGGGDLTANRTIDAVAHADGSIVIGADTIQVGVLASDAQHGNRGGDSLHALAVAGGDAGFLSGADKTKLDSMAAGAGVPATRLISAAGLATGGGDLSADRTITVTAGLVGDITEIHDSASAAGATGRAADAGHQHEHGDRAGGTLHALATQQDPGFMSPIDKTAVDLLLNTNEAAHSFLSGPATGAPAAPAYRALGLLDVPGSLRTTRDQAYISGVIAGTKYAAPGTISLGASADKPIRYFMVPGVGPAQAWTLAAVVGQLETAPGAGETLLVTVRKSVAGAAYADTAATFTISDAGVFGLDDAHNITFDSGDLVAIKVVASGGSAAAELHLTLVFVQTA